MYPMLPIYEETSATTRIVEVEEHKEINQVSIKILNQVERKYLEKHLLRPTQFTSKIQHFAKSARKELHQEVSTKVCSRINRGEIAIGKY